MSTAVLVAGFVMVGCLGLAGVLFVQGNDSLQRLGMLFALLGVGAAAFAALLRSDQGLAESKHTTDVASDTRNLVNGQAHALNTALERTGRAEGIVVGAGLAAGAVPPTVVDVVPPSPTPASQDPIP